MDLYRRGHYHNKSLDDQANTNNAITGNCNHCGGTGRRGHLLNDAIETLRKTIGQDQLNKIINKNGKWVER